MFDQERYSLSKECMISPVIPLQVSGKWIHLPERVANTRIQSGHFGDQCDTSKKDAMISVMKQSFRLVEEVVDEFGNLADYSQRTKCRLEEASAYFHCRDAPH